MLKKTPESLLDCKEIQPANPKGNQSWIFIGRSDADPENCITLATRCKELIIEKDSDVGKDWNQEEKGMSEDEMIGWHHWLNGCELEQALGVGDRQGNMACSSPWGHKESDTTEWLNWIDLLFLRPVSSSLMEVNVYHLELSWKLSKMYVKWLAYRSCTFQY